MQKIQEGSPNYLTPQIRHSNGHTIISYSCPENNNNYFCLVSNFLIYKGNCLNGATIIIIINTLTDEQYEYIWPNQDSILFHRNVKISCDHNTIIFGIGSDYILINLSTKEVLTDQLYTSSEYMSDSYEDYSNNVENPKIKIVLENNQEYEICSPLNNQKLHFSITDLQTNRTDIINYRFCFYQYRIETHGDMILLCSWNDAIIYRNDPGRKN